LKPIYIYEESVHNLSAPREVVPLIMGLLKPDSVLDVGCGIGTWLKAFEENGVLDYMGVDGSHVTASSLVIAKSKFEANDLRTAWSLDRKFDLVLSLEVAEHLPTDCADQFVKTLVNHGNTILFSAAIPGQGGQNHLNEQWPSYWQSKFENHGFYFHDVVRPLIWENKNIHWWYKQNIFLVTKNMPSERLQTSVHPECFASQVKTLIEYNKKVVNGELGIYHSMLILLRAFKKTLQKYFR
jgi:SAM-dependent methyltransferase